MTDAIDTSKNQQEKKTKPRRKDIINALLFIEATSPENPCRLEQMGLNLIDYQKRIDFLIKNKIICTVSLEDHDEELYYLDYEYYKEFKTQEDKRFFLTIVSIVIPGILFILLGIVWLVL